MAIMLGALYKALLEAHTPEATARLAAEEVAGYENRLTTIDSRLMVLTWMVGTSITVQLITLGGLVGLLWRLLPGGR